MNHCMISLDIFPSTDHLRHAGIKITKSAKKKATKEKKKKRKKEERKKQKKDM